MTYLCNEPRQSESGASASGRIRVRWTEVVVLGVVLLAVGWFYRWSAQAEDSSWNFGKPQRDYYNLLVDGMLDGRLSLKVDVPPELLSMSDPYDPATRPAGLGLHDASLYQGRYYLYFGVAPVVTLLLPFRVLTGTALPLPAAIVTFAYAGFLVSATLWLLVRRRYFPRSGVLLGCCGLLALGTATMVPVLVRRASVWELPISAGYFYSALAVLCVFQSLHARGRGLGWFAGASLSLGLAVASRPTYLYAAGLLLVPFLWRVWGERRRKTLSAAGVLRLAAAGFGPLVAVGIAMAWYNYARFGNPLEFGVSYQFSGIYEAKARHFSWSYLPYNLRQYGFAPFEWSRYFPFLHAPQRPAGPEGFFGTEEVCGVFRYMPLLWLGLAAPFLIRLGAMEGRRHLLVWSAAVAALGFGTLLTLGFFYAAIGRYETDFMPAFVLLGCVAAATLEERLQDARRVWRRTAGVVLAAVLSGAGAFVVLFSLGIYGNFQRSNPRAYASLARACNLPAAVYDHVRGFRFGPRTLAVRFPERPPGTHEPLLSAGWYRDADHLFVEYGGGSRIRLEFSHDSGTQLYSRWFTVTPEREYSLTASLGSLFPPEEHPVYATWRADAVREVTRRLHVELDGDVFLDAYQRFGSGAPDRVLVGREVNTAEFGTRFSGVLRETDRQSNFEQTKREHTARVALQFALPPDKPDGVRQPLATTDTDVAPVVWHVSTRAGKIVVGCTTAGGTIENETDEAADSRLHNFEIATRGVSGTGGCMWAVLDGVPVVTLRRATVDVPGTVALGRNTADLPVCESRFEGRFQAVAGFEDQAAQPASFDRISLKIALPSRRAPGAREPLVVTGVTGGADFFFIEYLDAARVRFGLEHWGKPGLFSPAIDWPDAQEHELLVVLGSFPGANRDDLHAAIQRDGEQVWATPARFYRADPADVFVGRNPVGGSACLPGFSGSVTDVKRLAGK